MRHITNQGLMLIKQFEGFSPTIYLDAAGLPTIGYGHLLRAGEAEMFKDGITEPMAQALLIKDVLRAEQAVLRLITAPLTNGQFDALVSFTFNLGSGALQRSTLRRKVNRDEHDNVPAELMKWVWAGGRKLKGLVKRRAAEAAVYMSPAISQNISQRTSAVSQEQEIFS
jgi:lysozyme